MLDPTKPVQTRDGRKARIVCTDFRNNNYPMIVLIDAGANEKIEFRPVDGQVHSSRVSDMDIINIPVETILYYQVDTDGQIKSMGKTEPYDAAIENDFWCSPKLLKITFIDDMPSRVELIENKWRCK